MVRSYITVGSPRDVHLAIHEEQCSTLVFVKSGKWDAATARSRARAGDGCDDLRRTVKLLCAIDQAKGMQALMVSGILFCLGYDIQGAGRRINHGSTSDSDDRRNISSFPSVGCRDWRSQRTGSMQRVKQRSSPKLNARGLAIRIKCVHAVILRADKHHVVGDA